MPKDILVMRVKNRLKIDEAIAHAKKVEEHLDGVYSVLILDKNVQDIEFFERPKDDVVVDYEDELDKELEEIEKGE
jgi:predicted acetyltransferase